MKRIFIIIAALVFIIGIGVGVYFLFFAPKGASLSVGDPFANTGSGSVAPNTDLPTDGMLQNAGTVLAPRFVKITDGPVAHGSVAFGIQIPDAAAVTDTPTETVSLSTSTNASKKIVATAPAKPLGTPDVEVRFIDRASGNVYSYIAHARTLTRISNKTLPGIQRVSWTPDGARAYAQFLATTAGEEQVNTYALTVSGGDGYLLENNLAGVHVAGSSTLFTFFSGSTGSVGTLSKLDGSGARTLFSSLLSALTVHVTSGDFFATNKPSSRLDGYAFQINRKDGGFGRILGPFSGLSVLPNQAGTSVLYSYTNAGAYQLRLLTLANRSSTALPVATLSEKCVWAASGISIYCAVPTNLQGNLPDDWYQGSVSFTDRIWKIDLTDRVATLIVDPSQVAKASIDAVDLTIDPSEDMLIFSDKHTGALYAYDL